MTDPIGRPAPEIVYLDVDDEITSAAARIRRLEAERLALVLPYGSRLATSRINFRLLAREATARGKHLEIVAADASARALAGSAGLVVYPSVAALESGEPSVFPSAGAGSAASDATGGGAAGNPPGAGASAARTFAVTGEDATETRVITVPRTPDPLPKVGRGRPVVRTRTAVVAGLLVALLLVVGALGAYAYLPSATIVLTPTAEQLGPIQVTVQARADVTAPDAATLTVPARTFSFPLSAQQTFNATGVKVTEAKATGNVTFSNLDTGRSNEIAAGAVVSTDTGIEFVTLAPVTLPPATIVFPFTLRPSTATVGVQAVDAGETGNVGVGAIDIVPRGENRNLTKVTNADPTTGGAHTESPQVSQQDIDAAMAALTTALRGDLDTKVRDAAGIPSGTVLFDTTEAVGDPVPSVDPATLLDQEVTTFDLGLTATGTALGVDPAPVTAVTEQRLAGQVGAGWQLAPGSTQIDVGAPTASGDVVSFPVTATATRTRVVDRDALLREVEGLVLAQARARLEAYGQVEITLWPDWVSSVPTNPDRISFTVGAPAPAPSPTP
ncbi:MAG TPA: hypothetical protein VGI98_00575 [Candidatus Limnocylindrales bacterium]|jgi:hypothetical protein